MIGSYEHSNDSVSTIKGWEFLNQMSNYHFLKDSVISNIVICIWSLIKICSKVINRHKCTHMYVYSQAYLPIKSNEILADNKDYKQESS
jgi:hypothetical protein